MKEEKVRQRPRSRGEGKTEQGAGTRETGAKTRSNKLCVKPGDSKEELHMYVA